jgi:hypothetical protein
MVNGIILSDHRKKANNTKEICKCYLFTVPYRVYRINDNTARGVWKQFPLTVIL